MRERTRLFQMIARDDTAREETEKQRVEEIADLQYLSAKSDVQHLILNLQEINRYADKPNLELDDLKRLKELRELLKEGRTKLNDFLQAHKPDNDNAETEKVRATASFRFEDNADFNGVFHLDTEHVRTVYRTEADRYFRMMHDPTLDDTTQALEEGFNADLDKVKNDAPASGKAGQSLPVTIGFTGTAAAGSSSFEISVLYEYGMNILQMTEPLAIMLSIGSPIIAKIAGNIMFKESIAKAMKTGEWFKSLSKINGYKAIKLLTLSVILSMGASLFMDFAIENEDKRLEREVMRSADQDNFLVTEENINQPVQKEVKSYIPILRWVLILATAINQIFLGTLALVATGFFMTWFELALKIYAVKRRKLSTRKQVRRELAHLKSLVKLRKELVISGSAAAGLRAVYYSELNKYYSKPSKEENNN